MKKVIFASVMFAFGTMLLTTSCEKNLFKKEVYKEYTRNMYPVDTLDESHTWSLLERMRVRVTADVKINDMKSIQILNDNPYTNGNAQILAEKEANYGNSMWFVIDIPVTQWYLYAAIVTKSGHYYVKQFDITQQSIKFSDSNLMVQGSMITPTYQTFTYLFEESFPEATDFDYNDLVLRISKQAPSNSQLKLTVTLSAVGASKAIAAAIRLPGVPYDKVENVTIDEEKPFDYDYSLLRSRLKGKANWGEAANGDAVINLFEDAHWSMSHETEITGLISLISYNTRHYEDEKSKIVPFQTRTFTVDLKGDIDAQYLMLSDFDPFIITPYNGVNFEIHTYPYKFEEVYWEFMGKDKRAYDDHLAWGLLIPDATFRYPIEDMPIGIYRNGELFGAYAKFKHSFGEWGRNQNEATDWWLNPTGSLVY